MADFTDTRVSEKKFYSIPDTLLTADGTIDGLVTVPSTYAYKVGMVVSIFSTTLQPRRLKIKRVISETQMHLGEEKTKINDYIDLSMFLLTDAATITYLEQQRPVIDILEIQRQVYEEEPTVALRSHSVDWLGRPYDKTNPVPVQLSDGSINIGTVNAELEVQLSHRDNVPNSGDVADSVRIGDGIETLAINPDGSINANIDGAVIALPPGAATEAKQDVGNSSLSSIDTKIPAQIAGRMPVDTGLSQALTDTQLRASPISVTTTNPITGFATEATQLAGNVNIASIDTKLNNLSVLPSGTIDGTLLGTKYYNVNNLRQQILATHDRDQTITYVDFGTKNQRITQIDYASPTFPAVTARKTVTYVLDGNRYKRTNITWTIV